MMSMRRLLFAVLLKLTADLADSIGDGNPFITPESVILEGDVPLIEFSSGVASYDNAFTLALTEMSENVENGTFIAGAGWKQLWTRDTSYAVELAAGLIYPEISKSSLKKSIEKDDEFGDVWLQDVCGHFGGWPHLSDAIVGARGAWSVYVITGDVDFLEWAYGITRNSLRRAERDVYDEATGLFLGCSSFMESNSGYPEKYQNNGELVGKTKALSTNMLHYAGYKLGAQMAQQLGKGDAEVQELNDKAQQLRESIRSRLWSESDGYYAYFEDEDNKLVTRMEGLGESLVLLGPDFEDDRVDSIFGTTYRTERGLPCLWPRFDTPVSDIANYYHNGRIWPFVQGYWGMAAARHGKVDVFTEELNHLVSLSEGHDTFAEFFEINGTFPEERRRQLWSDAGFLSMVFHGLFGMTFLPDGIRFAPIKPEFTKVANTFSLRRLPYRNMTLSIYVRGSGTHINSFTVDGTLVREPFVQANMSGSHRVVITLGDTDSDKSDTFVLLTSFSVAVVFIIAARRRLVTRTRRRSVVASTHNEEIDEAEALVEDEDDVELNTRGRSTPKHEMS